MDTQGSSDYVVFTEDSFSFGDSLEMVPVRDHPLQHGGVEYILNNSELPMLTVSTDKECLICYSEIKDSWHLPDCFDHRFCRECIASYLEQKIRDSRVNSLKCPSSDCRHVYSDEHIKDLVPQHYDRYLKYKARLELAKDPSSRWCTFPDCEGVMKGSVEKPLMACPLCKHQQCFKCGAEWHPRKSCEQLIEKAFTGWAKDKDVQLCPKCGCRIEKSEGCNHMTCLLCQHQWCWLCRRTYSQFHFNPMNPIGCPNLQYSDYTRSAYPLWRIYLMRSKIFLLILALIAMLPLILLLAPTVLITRKYYIRMRTHNHSRCGSILRTTSIGVATFVLTPLIYAISIPIGLRVLMMMLCRRR
mmetsp:Transcript_27302/g.49086  ORF Transcript_27302/g.49086 Transcript_27302/m.49086 type:complete len:357 (+) Transcript_27302:259-1329(+)